MHWRKKTLLLYFSHDCTTTSPPATSSSRTSSTTSSSSRPCRHMDGTTSSTTTSSTTTCFGASILSWISENEAIRREQCQEEKPWRICKDTVLTCHQQHLCPSNPDHLGLHELYLASLNSSFEPVDLLFSFSSLCFRFYQRARAGELRGIKSKCQKTEKKNQYTFLGRKCTLSVRLKYTIYLRKLCM